MLACLVLFPTVKAALFAVIVVDNEIIYMKSCYEFGVQSKHEKDWRLVFSNVCKALTHCSSAELPVYHCPQSAAVLYYAGRQIGKEKQLKTNNKRTGRLSTLYVFFGSVLPENVSVSPTVF